MNVKAIVFDLDDTLVDTSRLREHRQNKLWREAVANLQLTQPFQGMQELLTELSRHKVSIAIVTTSVSYYAAAVLQHHGIRYDKLVAYHDAPRKPSPAPVLLALKHLNVDSQDAAGIGDSLTDNLAYKAAHIRSIGASWSPFFMAGEWDRVVKTPAEIPSVLE